MPSIAAAAPTPLTRNQVRGFWAAWGGWALDGMDSFIYALVLTPAITELLPRSGIEATPGNIGYYGSLLFALFLFGWGCSMVWGPLADRYGRVKTLMLTILCYSVFTGIGGEWSMGGTFVAEEWPEDRRKTGAGYMHTGYYFGFFLAALANYFIGARYGWRVMFALGGLPALLVGFIRHGVHESARWQTTIERTRPSMIASFGALFSSEYARRTVLNSLFLLVSVVGLWAGSVYVPTSVTQLARAAGYTAPQAAQMASYGTMVLSAGTILGCLGVAPLAERYGRRLTLGFYFVIMFLSIAIGFGYVFYLGSLSLFMIALFFLGVGGANFAMYTLWLPEQYSTECRASAFAFATSVGRFAGAGITFLVGAAVSYYGTLGTPVAFTSVAFLLGLLILPLGEETLGKPLPK